MWFLEHESLFGGKRVWLRPGSQQLFGRTKPSEADGEGKQWMIDNKAVSRKHVMIKVHETRPGDGTKLHTRSQVDVIDLSCRQGTKIDEDKTLKSKKCNGDTLEYDTATLTGTEHTIRLAQSYAPFKIVWRPVVFTYASRESKDSKTRSTRLHALDIKTTTDFVYGQTTHVVSQKRNLPKVLSGLVAGKHIVTGDFLDDVLSVATTSVDVADKYVPSKLEEDFDEYWPKEKECIPPIGAEPTPRTPEMLEPDALRQEVFSGLTFIFLDESQYGSLLDPVTGGGGKALYYEVKFGETTVQEYVDYVRSVAGKKKSSGANKDKLPVVTVRLGSHPDGMDAWVASFVTGVDQALGQRSLLQNEFLDAIITRDRASLQRPPPVFNSPPSAPEPAPAQRSTRDLTPMSQPRANSPEKSASLEKEEPVKVSSRKRSQRRTGGKFTGFDDYEPPPKRKKVEGVPREVANEDVQESMASYPATQHHAAPATQTQTQRTARQTIEKEEQMDAFFPAAAKMRSQRAATRAPSASVEPETNGSTPNSLLKSRPPKPKPKDINVLEQTRLRVKEEEDRRIADEASLREALQGIDIAAIRDVTEIVPMELRPRTNLPTARSSQASSARWHPDWNGRKNFKKFQRRGTERGVQTHKVMVPVEEAPQKKGFGYADAFLLDGVEPPTSFTSRHSKGKQVVEEVSDDEPGFRRQRSQKSQPAEVVNVEESELENEDEERAPVTRTQRSSGRTQRSSGRTQRVAETQVDDTQKAVTRGKKRGPAHVDSPLSKKARGGRRDDDSDEEETGFRFKRRGG